MLLKMEQTMIENNCKLAILNEKQEITSQDGINDINRICNQMIRCINQTRQQTVNQVKTINVVFIFLFCIFMWCCR